MTHSRNLILLCLLNVNDPAQSGGTEDVFVIEVPQDVLDDSNSLVYSLYDTPVLFQVLPPSEDHNVSMEADTMVVGFSLLDGNQNRNISNLLNPIIITFQSIRAQNKLVCEIINVLYIVANVMSYNNNYYL